MKNLFLYTNIYLWIIFFVLMIFVGYLISIEFIYISSALSLMTIVLSIVFNAWIVNPICSINKKIIYRGFRRPLLQIPFCLPRVIYTKKLYISKSVIFNETAKIEHDHINKLFGFSISDFFEFNSVHKNSFRFGWSYNKSSDKINIYYYSYINGNRDTKLLAIIPFNNTFSFTLKKENENIYFEVFDVIKNKKISNFNVKLETKKIFGNLLGLYYGGKPKSPHKIIIKMW